MTGRKKIKGVTIQIQKIAENIAKLYNEKECNEESESESELDSNEERQLQI